MGGVGWGGAGRGGAGRGGAGWVGGWVGGSYHLLRIPIQDSIRMTFACAKIWRAPKTCGPQKHTRICVKVHGYTSAYICTFVTV